MERKQVLKPPTQEKRSKVIAIRLCISSDLDFITTKTKKCVKRRHLKYLQKRKTIYNEL